MKKSYESPLATEVKIESNGMLATSPNNIGVGSGPVGPESSLSIEKRGSWGNLWK